MMDYQKLMHKSRHMRQFPSVTELTTTAQSTKTHKLTTKLRPTSGTRSPDQMRAINKVHRATTIRTQV